MTGQVSVLAALGAGVLTFLSPCVLPLIPGYIAFMSGVSSTDTSDERRRVPAVLLPALLFVSGFTIVFVVLGASASLLGPFFTANKRIFEIVAGIVLVALGLFMLGVIKAPWLYGEARFEMHKARRFGPLAGLVMGMAFAFGWSPCVGPILGSILMLAVNSAEAGRGALLLAVYSAGLGIPFLAVALALGRITPVLNWLNRRALVINRVAGAVLIALGGLIATGWLAAVVGELSDVVPRIGG